MADFTLTNHGSIYLLTPHTDAAEAWIGEHIPEDAQTLGPSVAIEWRYVSDIADGIEADGLSIG